MSDSWSEIPFGELAAPVRNAIVGGPFGSDLISNDYVSAGTPVIRGQNMQGRWVGGEFVYVTDAKADLLSGNLARAGDLIFTQRGTLGQVALVPKRGAEKYLVSQSQMKATIDPLKADPVFLYYFFSSSAQQEWIRSNAIQTGVPHTNLGILKKHPVLLPSLAEQRLIAAVLGSLDDKIEQNRRAGRALEGLARATFKAWFVDFEPVKAKAAGAAGFPGMPRAAFAALPDRFTDSSVGPVPQGWEIVAVYKLAKVVYGAPFASKLFNDRGAGKPLIRIRDLQTHSPSVFTTERHAKGTLIRPGEIVVGMDGEFRLHYWTGPEAWLNQRLCSFQPLPSVPTMYLGEALRAPLDYVERSEAATTVIHLGKYDIDRFELLRPDTTTLSAFDHMTTPMLSLMVQTAAESSKLAALRDYLLPRLLSGRVRVRPSQPEEKG